MQFQVIGQVTFLLFVCFLMFVLKRLPLLGELDQYGFVELACLFKSTRGKKNKINKKKKPETLAKSVSHT